ncbi:MAG: hypothetical protein ABEI31_06090 [Halodesulfurarchaeum sp.]
MSNAQPTRRESREWTSTNGGLQRVVFVGLVVGVLAGMGTFVFSRPSLSPTGSPWLGILLLAGAGAYAHLLSRSTWESVRGMVVGFVVGVGTTIGAWVVPLWLVPMPTAAREVLFMAYLQQALTTIFMAFVLVYFAGYFLIVSLEGILG